MIAELYRRADRREFDILVTWDISRVARTVRQIENLIYDLNKRGAIFDSVSESYVKHPVMRQVMGAMAEEQTRIIARNVASAIRRQVARGSHNGQTPYGYRVDLIKDIDGKNIRKLIPVPDLASVVLTVYQRFADGVSISDLRRWLSTDPTVPPRPRGGQWSSSALWFLLRFEVYTGVVSVKGDTPAGKLLQDIRVENAHEAIVPRELFDRVQRRLGERRPHVRDLKEHHWLEQHIFCSACGSPMYFIVRQRQNRNHLDRSWSCQQATLYRNGQRADPCPAAKPNAGYLWVERATEKGLIRALSRAGAISDEALRKHLGKPDDRGDRMLATIRQTERERDRLLDSLQHGMPSEAIAPRVRDLTERIAALNRERAMFAPVRTFETLQVARAFAAEAVTDWGRLEDEGRRAVVERVGLRVELDAAERRVRLSFGGEFDWL